MMVRKLLPMLAVAALALVIAAACGGGDDGDGGFTFPSAGTYEFDVTGTMDVEFSAPGASIAPVRLQQTVTGQVDGTASVELRADGTGTFNDYLLSLRIEVQGDTVRIGMREAPGRDSTVTVGPEGTDMDLVTDFFADAGDGVGAPLDQVQVPFQGTGDPFTQDEWTGSTGPLVLSLGGDFGGDGTDDGLVLRDGEFVFTRISTDASEPTDEPAEPSGGNLPDSLLALGGILGLDDPASLLERFLGADPSESGLQPFIDIVQGGTVPVNLTQGWIDSFDALGCGSVTQGLTIDCSDPGVQLTPGSYFWTFGVWPEGFPDNPDLFCFSGVIFNIDPSLPAIPSAFDGDPEGGANLVLQLSNIQAAGRNAGAHTPSGGGDSGLVVFEYQSPDPGATEVARAFLFSPSDVFGPASGEGDLGDVTHLLESGCYDQSLPPGDPPIGIDAWRIVGPLDNISALGEILFPPRP